ncbi:hypothetical protein JKP88DRAFT_284621 [Tribonema minus]|uniref:Uncharacterized protein n=1 Tax=Tribonema minus TaxID=303371 RepID=A0A836CMP9_9STRA|nr:hypothetical protein JKP88DRAFT_284621 [Tribonema minus]
MAVTLRQLCEAQRHKQLVIDGRVKAQLTAAAANRVLRPLERKLLKRDLLDSLQQYKRLRRDNSGARHLSGVHNFIMAGVLRDLDGENMHPRIFLALCELQGIDAPYLREYLELHERVLSEIAPAAADGCDRDGAKEAVLVTSCGGIVRTASEWLRGYAREARRIAQAPRVYANCGLGGVVTAAVAHGGAESSRLMSDSVMPQRLRGAGDMSALEALAARYNVGEEAMPKLTDEEEEEEDPKWALAQAEAAAERAVARGGGGGGGGGGAAAYETGSDAGDDVEPREPDLWFEKTTILDSVGEEELQSALAQVLVLKKAHGRVIFVTQRRLMAHTLTRELRKLGIDTVMSHSHGRYLVVIEEEAKRGKDYAERRASIKFEPRDCCVLVIEYKSLRRLKPGACAYVILDEFRAIMIVNTTTLNSDTNAESKMTNFARLKALVIAALRVIYISADMTRKHAAVRSDVLMNIVSLKRGHCDSLRRSMERPWVLQQIEEGRQAVHASARLFDGEFTRSEVAPTADHTAHMEQLDTECRAAMEAVVETRTPEPVDRSIAPLSIKIIMANTMHELLSEYVPWGTVGLYTSETGNREDLQHIEEMVWRIFTSLRQRCATAMDGMQQQGRFCKCITGDIWLGVIDRLADEELERMDACTINLAVHAASAFETLGPLDSTFAAAMYPLQLAAAYGAVDRRYTESVRSWIAMYKYLALSKGYAWRGAPALSKSAAAEVAEIKSTTLEMLQRDSKEEEKQLLQRLHVEFWERYGRALCRAVGEKRVLRVARLFPRAPACELPIISSDLKVYGNKMLRVSYLQDVMDKEAMELGKTQQTPVLECLVDMLATLGTALDSDRPVRLAQHDAALLARPVKRIQELKVTHSLTPEHRGKSAYYKVRFIVAKQLGIELANGKPPALVSHPQKLPDKQPVFPSAADWDGLNPTEDTPDDDLNRIMNELQGDQRFTGKFQRATAIMRSRTSQRKRHHAEQSAEGEAFEHRQCILEALQRGLVEDPEAWPEVWPRRNWRAYTHEQRGPAKSAGCKWDPDIKCWSAYQGMRLDLRLGADNRVPQQYSGDAETTRRYVNDAFDLWAVSGEDRDKHYAVGRLRHDLRGVIQALRAAISPAVCGEVTNHCSYFLAISLVTTAGARQIELLRGVHFDDEDVGLQALAEPLGNVRLRRL